MSLKDLNVTSKTKVNNNFDSPVQPFSQQVARKPLYDIPNRCKSWDKIYGVHDLDLVTEDLDFRIEHKYAQNYKTREDIIWCQKNFKTEVNCIKADIGKVGIDFTNSKK